MRDENSSVLTYLHIAFTTLYGVNFLLLSYFYCTLFLRILREEGRTFPRDIPMDKMYGEHGRLMAVHTQMMLKSAFNLHLHNMLLFLLPRSYQIAMGRQKPLTIMTQQISERSSVTKKKPVQYLFLHLSFYFSKCGFSFPIQEPYTLSQKATTSFQSR